MKSKEITEEERKWIESLKRCLKKKPDTVEILVHEDFHSVSGCKSTVYMMKKGVIFESQESVDDLLKYNPSDYSIGSIDANGVAANNHGY